MIIIAISGKKKSGKDTVAGMLVSRLPELRIVKFNFADPLKDEVCWNYKISREYLETHKDNFRLILQGHGTDYRRKLFGEDYWIKQWEHKMRLFRETGVQIVLTTDVRFRNEAQTVVTYAGVLIRVSRNETASFIEDKHASETEMDDYKEFDYTIRNDNSLQMLELEVDALVECLKKQKVL